MVRGFLKALDETLDNRILEEEQCKDSVASLFNTISSVEDEIANLRVFTVQPCLQASASNLGRLSIASPKHSAPKCPVEA